MKRIYKALVFLFTLSFVVQHAYAQYPYGNEWINYNNTYYKFKVGANGIFRIAKSALDAAGVPATINGNQFMLYRDGQEVPVYVTTNGSFSAGDYIEFYGKKLDGKLDLELYKDATAQANDRNSLFTDTACYYLTYDNQTNHSRYTSITNPVTGGTPADFCLTTVGNYFKANFNVGVSYASGYSFPSSQFDRGEGFLDYFYNLNQTVQYTLPTPNLVNTGSNANFSISLLAFSYTNQHNVRVYINNQQIADTTYGAVDVKRINRSVPANILTASNTIKVEPYNWGTGYDYWGTSFFDVEYPRNFDISGLNYFPFRLLATSSSYLEFTNYTGAAPRLYDVTNQKWYTGDVTVANKARFQLDPSIVDRELLFYVPSVTPVTNLNAVKTIHFTDYSQAANQGNYIIISHKDLMTSSGGHNYVDDYKNYRISTAGGGYKAIVAEIGDLYDEFGYGVDIHPLSIKHFMKYAYDKWTTPPSFLFIIGRGMLYPNYAAYQASKTASPSLYPYPIVPTYGHPGADVNFANLFDTLKMNMSVGRFSAWNGDEIGVYLDKIKSFEAGLKPATLPTYKTELWKKQVLHIAGSSDATTQTVWLLPTLNLGAAIISDTAMGGLVTTIAKNTTNPVDNVNSAAIDSMINNGLGIVTFHGHASSAGFDFNLNNPEQYNSIPKLPLFIALGCDVAQIFSLLSQKTISERYLDAPTGGSTGMIAADNENFPDFHRNYLQALYANIGNKYYGKTVGEQFRYTYDSIMHSIPSGYSLAHLESLLLQGDPALHIYAAQKPDYHVSADAISSTPANVTTSQDSFKLNVISFNLGRAIADTVIVKVEHINPAGVMTTVTNYPVVNLYNMDTTSVSIPISKLADLGLNKYRVTIDAPNKYDEISETNNTATFELFIYSDNLIPVYPYEYSIVHQQGVTLKASTLNPFRPVGKYRIQIDTTALFNSSLLQQTSITSASGVISWTPTISMQDSTVYYWRTTFDSTVNGVYQWSASSFIYLAQGSDGWNQSHYYQYAKDKLDSVTLDADRKFRFSRTNEKIDVVNRVSYSGTDDNVVSINDLRVQPFGCDFTGTIQIMVFDSATGQPWLNNTATGSLGPCSSNPQRDKFAYEFNLNTPASRNNARLFINSIPDGNYALIRNFIYNPLYQGHFVSEWESDTLTYGSGNSLYHALRNIGFTQVDSMYDKRVFVFFCQKNRPAYPLFQGVSKTSISATNNDSVVAEFFIPVYSTTGNITSTIIGPAKEWQSLKWKVSPLDTFSSHDSTYITVTGITPLNTESILYTGLSKDTTLSFINAAVYPNLRLQWYGKDTITRTSPQLNYWRVLYTPVPEAALNPAKHYVFSDSIHVGQMLSFSSAIENLTNLPMDSMLVKYKVIDANNVSHLIGAKRYRRLPGDDTLNADFTFDPTPYPGTNLFFVEANPDNDQPEQYHPNNLGYIPFKVISDVLNPLVDVTFDGVHILNEDIVSSRPYIKILLKDENKFVALDDTSMITVNVRYPNDPPGTQRRVPFDGTTCKFIPASLAGNSGKNEASIEYRPILTQDSTYELFVSGHDKAGNPAGGTSKVDYSISFNVFNTPSISNVLNYPNPFSTATAFVFTLTGYEMPSQLKIQIMTVTGKVVREITKGELGPLHIGRNITEYRWDGRDQYGQMLGNGVYLYRVVTSLNGDNMEHRESASDQYFKKGWGKMYIMR